MYRRRISAVAFSRGICWPEKDAGFSDTQIHDKVAKKESPEGSL